MIIEENELTALFDEFYLIEETPTAKPEIRENKPKLHYEGGNGTGLVFVFNHVLSETDNDMIQKLIHNALKIKMEDIALVNFATQQEQGLTDLIHIIKPKQVVVWGHSALFPQAGLYQVLQHETVRYINVDAVHSFHDNVALKTTLWNAIQQLRNG